MVEASVRASRRLLPLIRSALREDCARHDITSRLLYPPGAVIAARLVARAPGVLCGLEMARRVFAAADRRIRWSARYRDGAAVQGGTVFASVCGPARGILAAERTAMNLVGRLSGIATLTHRYVWAARGTSAAIFDTRKTTPGLRFLERYAVRCGGGVNHRFDLGDQILVKRNHLIGLGAARKPARLTCLLRDLRRRAPRGCRIEVELFQERQVAAVLAARPDIVMLDNLSPAVARRVARRLRRQSRRPLLEVSGGVTLRNVRAFASAGVDRIAVGMLTHSAPWLDVALEVERPARRGTV